MGNNWMKEAMASVDKLESNALPEKSPAGWDFSRKKLVDELRSRLSGANLPDQGNTNNCGPAAFLYCLLKDRPDWYAKFAVGLWEDGEFDLGDKAGGQKFQVKPSPDLIEELANTGSPDITKLDFMTMASLSESSVAGITTPGSLKNWFGAVGSPAHQDTFGIDTIGHLASSYLIHQDFEDFRKIIRYYNHCWIVMEINPRMIDAAKFSTFDRHWVVVNKDFHPHERKIYTKTKGKETLRMIEIQMHFVTWGNEKRYKILPEYPESMFVSQYYGAGAFPRIP